MKKICNTLLCFSMLIFTFIFALSIKPMNVHAAQGAVGGGAGIPAPVTGSGGGGGSSAYNQPLAYGYRVSIVKKDGTYALNPDGSSTHSFDYWSTWGSAGFNELTKKTNLKLYNTQVPKTLRKEGDSTKITSINGSNYKYGEETLVKTFYDNDTYNLKTHFTAESFKCYNETWKGMNTDALTSGGCGAGGDRRIGNNLTRYVLYAMEKSMDNENYEVFGKILKDCGIQGNTAQERIFNASSYYAIVEPLIAIKRSNENDYSVGTINDLYKMGYLKGYSYYVYNNFMYINPIVWNTLKDGPLNVCSTNPNNFDNLEKLSGKGCAGAFTFYVGDVIDETCSSVVTDAISSSSFNERNLSSTIDKLNSNYVSENAKKWLKQYKNYGFKDLNSLKDYLSKNSSCPEPTCNTSASNFISLKGNEKDGLKEFISKYPYYSKYKDLASSEGKRSNFDLIVAGINNVTIDSEGKYCSASSCQSLFNANKNNASAIDAMDSIFNNGSLKYPLLNKNFRQELGITDLNSITGDNACKEIPKCDPGEVVASCAPEASNTITFTDNQDKLNECVKSGYAYTISSGDAITNVQSSKEAEYNYSTYGNVYCSETVELNLPKDVKTKAGNLLTWGNNDQESDVFGTMELKRTCYFPELYTKSSATIKSDWIDDINPFIQINYEQALPDGMTKQTLNERLGIRLRLFKTEDTANLDTLNYVKYDDEGTTQYCDKNGNNCQATPFGGNNPRTISCSNDLCSKLGSNFAVTFTLDYDIIYNDTLTWYSNKSEHFEYSTSSEITHTEGEIESNYTYIGYGLPTSFATATTCLNTTYGYSKDSSENVNGKLYLTIKNIGTKNSSGETYHFDKIISTKYKVTDDYNAAYIMEGDQSNDSLVYSCGFNIYNELFGYEDGDGSSETCDNEAPEGIDVVFRTVDLVSSEDELSEAFPGRSGTGRERGRNWAKLSDTNVAHILRNSVYDNEPMYEITLTAGKIQKIRSLNKVLENAYSDMTVAENNGSSSDGYKGYTYYKYRASDSSLQMTKCSYLYPDENSKEREDCDAIAEAMLEDYGDASTGGASSLTVRGPVASNFVKYLIDSEGMTGRCATGYSDNSSRINRIFYGCED